MCGIVGEWNIGATRPQELVHRASLALAMIRHRGPDQFGIYADPHAALGNARLSIVDLNTGQQPISNEDESLWIVFNGEIFNHVELRPELEARGHRFRTKTDTEVILHLYEELGPDCVHRLNGQFAIAIWDRRKQTLFLARDRLGVRPLFYWNRPGKLVFGSEIKSLLIDPEVPSELDPIAIGQIFTLWSPVSPRTAFRNILQLPPGHTLLVGQSGLELRRYWSVQFPDAVNATTLPTQGNGDIESAEQLRELLIDASRIRLRADVTVGAYLSGGLDSSIITSIIRHHTATKLQTFSISFSDTAFDESAYQRAMAKYLDTEHHVVTATHADIGRVFPEVIWHTEIPTLRTSPAPMFLLSKLVRDRGIKVVLTGEGADEFLAGYDIFKESKIRRFWAQEPDSRWRWTLFKRLYPEIQAIGASRANLLAAFFKSGLKETGAADYSHSVRWRNNRRTCRFFSQAWTDQQHAADPNGTSEVRYPEEFSKWGPLEQAQFLEIDLFLSQYLLSSQGDRVGMAHSVEARFPFLDVRVVEFCNRLASRSKLRGLREKHLLREAAKGLLPDEILQRRKRPYRAPIHRSFFHESTPDYLKDLLSESWLQTAGIFDPSPVSQLVHKIQRGGAIGETDDMAIAGIISTQLCWEQFVANRPQSVGLTDQDDVRVCLMPSWT